ncbi:DNA primase family protein [Vallitalea sp.]|jgi:putative DNA primase/helicase|uniref:DNA primase family protein n=1 Tax=Vallitalea sp. TaxID=1882829 RepID=UPI0025EAA847|nr:DNA primase family protein [Vallitalea sp.]MCT4686605.1 phage/plasmid primase, P4 family [Vallitalea sp.]
MSEWEKTGFYKAFTPTKNDEKKPLLAYTKSENQFSWEQCRFHSGILGLLADDAVLLDADEEIHSNNLLKVIQGEKLSCMMTNREGGRGIHALFKNISNRIKNNGNNVMLACGIKVDIKVGCKNGLECIKFKEVERISIYDTYNYQDIPKWLLPIKRLNVNFADLEEGGRNQSLYNYILTLQSNDFTVEEIKETIRIINKYVFKVPLSEDEVEIILRDESFRKQSFFKGNKFLHDKFAISLKNNHYIIRNDGNTLIYKDGVYEYSYRDIEQAMVREIPSLKDSQRKEVLKYLNLICDEVHSSSTTLIAFRNGVLNIETGELLSFSPDYIITNKIPWDYNPNAHSKIADITLNRIACDDAEIRSILEEMIGACFYRSNTLAGGKAFILTGEGANGKSTFISILNRILGKDNTCSLDLKKLDDKFSTVMMYKKLANLGDDISDEFNADVSVFKKIVTGNSVDAQEKGQPKFNFEPYCKLIFSANNIPRMKDKTGAAQRRLLIVPFNARFNESDMDYDPQITWKLEKQEAVEYFIMLGVEGLKRVLQNNKFTSSIKVQKELNEYAERNNPVLSFIKDCKDEDIQIINEPLNKVYQIYQGFCIRSGYIALAKNEFSKQIQRTMNLLTFRKRINKVQTQVFIANE